MKIAIVHDWLVTYAGAERVLEQIIKTFPGADLFSTVDFLESNEREFLLNKKVNVTFLQKLPWAKSKYRNYLPLMPIAIEQLDLSSYDVIISSSSAVAKGVITGPNQIHISYINSPIRYAWDLQHQYLKETGLDKGVKGWIAKLILHYIRLWDLRTANGVDEMVANSEFIRKRIAKVYRREAKVIYPPIDVENFVMRKDKEDFYLTASRFVPYKKIDLIVETFSCLPEKKLVVIGDGPDFEKIKKRVNGKPNIELMGYQSNEVLRDYMGRARCFLFAAEEDFGIVPLEAQASGTPVIAYGRGGALETVLSENDSTKPTGIFFQEQTVESLLDAIHLFEKTYQNFLPEYCRENALRFSTTRFVAEFKGFVISKVNQYKGEH